MQCRMLAIPLILAGLLGCSGEEPADNGAAVETQAAVETGGAVTGERLRQADSNNSEWLTHGRTWREQRFSPLDTVNTKNVDELGLAWHYELDTDRGQEATPLVIDGVIYFTSAWSKAFALDARTGEELWTFDPEVPRRYGVNACCDVVNRGLAAWGDKVFLGTIDGRLIALDRETGEVDWSVQSADPEQRYTITGAPRVIEGGRVIIGNGGAELGVRGYVTAYDAATGEQLWRFYTVPGNPADGFENETMEMAAATWSGEWWTLGGGGTAWDSMAYDAERDLLYIGVGNGSPWNHQLRSGGEGDNLFLSSIVALRGATGEYVWHFQTTPAESWDFTATQHMILADLEIGGETREVIMQAPKNGYFYMLDRVTGEFLSGENYVDVNWAQGLDPVTGRPIETELTRYEQDPAIVIPGPLGGHNWYPMSYSRDTGLVYIPTQSTSYLYAGADEIDRQETGWNLGQAANPGPPVNPEAAERAQQNPLASLLAWDPVAQEPVWRVDHSAMGNGGVLSTAGGLVFQGAAEGAFNAYDSRTGERLWSQSVGDAILGGPVTYELDGEQYVLALAGQGGAIPLTMGLLSGNYPRQRNGRLMAFRLGGDASLPEVEMTTPTPLDVSNADSGGNAAAGEVVYGAYCSVCHGPAALSAGPIPDLRYSATILDSEVFRSIVIDGALADRGMVGFSQDINAEDAENVRAWLLERAADAGE